jgi:small subunit ribosomal protein S2
MSKIEVKDLLEAGVHFGHLTRKWNPNMAPFIHMERNGIHIINLYKTVTKIEEAQQALHKIAASGRKILFVATKKQAKDIVSTKAGAVKMPYITERWPGGMLTNFVTIRKAVKKMAAIDRMKSDGTFNTLSKKERLQVDRMRAKLEKNLGSISEMTRLPGALFIVDIRREHIAVREAQKLNIPIFAMVDTNADPREVEYAIPANDDASKSIDKVLGLVTEAVATGLTERKKDRDEANAASSEGEVVPEAAAAGKTAKEAPAAEPVAEEKVEVAAPAGEEVAEKAPATEASEDLSGKTVTELKALAKAASVSGYSKMKKAELIAALSA